MKQQESIQCHVTTLNRLNCTEDPIDVVKFISDPEYLGESTSHGRDIYPIWHQALQSMFQDKGKYLVVLTGSIGTGKSTIAILALCYIQYRLMILRNPWGYFGLADAGKMTISFFNLTKSLGDSRGFRKMQDFMSRSPWFRTKAVHIARTRQGETLEFQRIKYKLSSPYSMGVGIVGEDVVAGVLDEVDSPVESIGKKERVLSAYNSTVLRFRSRFAAQGYSIGKLFIVSSKQDELSFIDTFITTRKNTPEVLIFDIPLWEAKPSHIFCGEKFLVAVGDAYNPPKIIEEVERVTYAKNGFEIVEIPTEFKQDFQLDLIGSLRDIAGVTVAGMRRLKLFPSVKFISDCFDETKLDPITYPLIKLGLQDEDELIRYVQLNKFRMPNGTPRFIHFDISFSGDASGIAMSGIKEWRQVDVEKEDGTFGSEIVPVIETDFIMKIRAKPGDRIPIHKVRKFVLDLRAYGINVYRFTADLRLASEDTLQILQKAGISAEYASMDKTPKPYTDFRNIVYEQRWICHNHSGILFELKHIEQNQQTGKIDHPEKVTEIEFLNDGGIQEVVMEGSKDIADAVVGSVTQCLYESKKPMNVPLMKNLLNKTKTDRTVDPSQEATKLFDFKDKEGKPILGQKTPDGIAKVSDILRRIHGR